MIDTQNGHHRNRTPKYLYRTENAYGSGERNLRAIIEYEVFELGNTDIFDYMLKHYDFEKYTLKSAFLNTLQTMREMNGDSDPESVESFERVANDIGKNTAKKAFMDSVMDLIKYVTGKNIRYGLWLAEKDAVIRFYNNMSKENIDTYRTSDVILSDLNEDGILFGYEEKPKPVSPYDEIAKLEILLDKKTTDIENDIEEKEDTRLKYENKVCGKIDKAFNKYSGLVNTMEHINKILTETTPEKWKAFQTLKHTNTATECSVRFDGQRPDDSSSIPIILTKENNTDAHDVSALRFDFVKRTVTAMNDTENIVTFRLMPENIFSVNYNTLSAKQTLDDKCKALTQIDDLLDSFVRQMPKFVEAFTKTKP